MDNNIFSFATSELSQDAVICWCINWFNYKDSDLFPLSKDMLCLVCPQISVSDNDEVIIIRQWYKTDILLYFKSAETAVIIEDKIYSSEHDDQISTYIKKINSLTDREKAEKNIANISPEKLYTVYFKTGFFYDTDKKVKADLTVTGKQFLKVINKYKDRNIILGYYYEHLNGIVSWYDIYGSINADNITDHQIAQYNLMRYIFKESLWDKTSSMYEVCHGSNLGGSPWTEMTVFKGKFRDNRAYSVFWRIDTDSNGPYMSLRLYDGSMDKNSAEHRSLHSDMYDKMRAVCNSICNKMGNAAKWDDIRYRDTRSYKESTLVRFDLTNVIDNWNDKKDHFSSVILEFNEYFINECQMRK